MIDRKSFSREWIEKQRTGAKNLDPIILEKMIYAFGLLEELQLTGFDFVFKGGTSLILLFNEPKRFSIDIDIVTVETRSTLEEALGKICEGPTFSSFQLEERRSYLEGGLPKAHFKLYFQTQVGSGSGSILLDVIHDDHTYKQIQKTEIKSNWLLTNDPLTKVQTPSIESILGDKLTAFAPNTTGIQYGKGKELEIIKQLFDISKLLEQVNDFAVVKDTFQKTAKREITYRNLEIQPADVLIDIIKSCLLLCQAKAKGDEAKKRREFIDGLGQIKNHLFGEKFGLNEAWEASGRVALLASSILNHLGTIPEVTVSKDLREHMIENQDFNYLNKLIKTGVTSIAHWEVVIEKMVGEKI